LLEAGNIDSLALLRKVAAAVVNNNANATGSLAPNASLLELSKREAAAFAQLAVVPHSWCTYSRTQQRQGASTKGGCLRLTRIAPAKLTAGLVEPSLDTSLPILVEVVCGEYVVVTETHFLSVAIAVSDVDNSISKPRQIFAIRTRTNRDDRV
jgi:hypothetical protein